MSRLSLMLGLVLLAACPPGSGSKEREPAGTPTDPVTTCERAGDVCRLDDSRLGVCVEAANAGETCAGETCYRCTSQH